MRKTVWTWAVAAMACAGGRVQHQAQGIPEPPVIFYGRVVDNRTPANVLKTNGVLRVVLKAGADEVSYSTTLQSIDGMYSYILMLPAETTVTGFMETANYLKLRSPAIGYSITASLDGQPLFLEKPSLGELTMTGEARGLVRAVNLLMAEPPPEDTDGNGLGDAWERMYFGRIEMDPNGDPDRDGKTNLQEFRDGTDPKDRTFIDIRILSITNGIVRLSFETKPGKTYTLDREAKVPFSEAAASQLIQGHGSNYIVDIDFRSPGTQFFRLR